ncbi:MAG: hypothetical protein JST00_41340 [Deltaproteobacteria bacterium]|nr:hypothetical protein [Deltaproteobacteria bacterium]
MRRIVIGASGLLFCISGIVALGAACTEPPATAYGNPNTLDRENLPGEGGALALTCTGDAGGEAGSFDGGCPSFANDIYPYFQAAGKWRCADNACHGGSTAPKIDDTNAANCLASLKGITVAKLPYVSSDGGKDPGASSLLCNLQGSCGSKMPKPPGVDPTDGELCMVEAWIKCGSPP